MVTVYGPAAAAVPDAYATSANTLWTGHLVAGQVISLQWNGCAITPGAPTTGGAEVNIYATTGGSSLLTQFPVTWGVAGGGTYTLLATWDISIETQNGGGASPTGHDTGELFNLQIDIDPPAGGAYCTYGTQPKVSTSQGVTVTTNLIDTMLAAIGAPLWLALIFDVFTGTVLYPGGMCLTPPEPFPVFTTDDYVAGFPNILNPVSRAKWWSALLAVAWPYFCECAPATGGGGAPIPYPPFTPVPPLGAPAGPTVLVCDNTDLCTALNSLARQIVAMMGQVAALRSDVTLIQRQGVPFGYVAGTSHGPLSGSGDFAVQGIIGLEVAYSSIPSVPGHSAGDPDTYHQIGKVSLGTAAGWRRSWMPTHDPYIIFPLSGAFTRVGYTFPVGAVATITELLREP